MISVPWFFFFFCYGRCSEFKLGSEELERWFTKIDHIFEHTRVPRIREAPNPFFKISIDKVQQHHLPLISHISYKWLIWAFFLLFCSTIESYCCTFDFVSFYSTYFCCIWKVSFTSSWQRIFYGAVFLSMLYRWGKRLLLFLSMPLRSYLVRMIF